MPHAIRFHQTGSPDVLQWEDVAVGDPGPGEARVRHTAIGLNYIDTYHRSGLYKVALPSGLGNEAAGVVEAVGAGVTHVKPGDRVAYGTGPLGAYSEARIMPAGVLLKLPEGVSVSELAQAMQIKATDIIKKLMMDYKVMATVNQKLNKDVVETLSRELVAARFGHRIDQ